MFNNVTTNFVPSWRSSFKWAASVRSAIKISGVAALMAVITLFYTNNVYAQPGEGYQINEQDSLALIAFYESNNGDDWVNNSGWQDRTDPVFAWPGIELVENVAGEGEPADWRVTRIDMPRNNMTVPGTIPPEIEDLEYLEWFKSDVNLHIGTLPTEFANLERLERMLVRTNLFTGEVDWAAFAQMPVMQQFRIRDNYFTGDLPTMLGGEGTWPALQRFYVDDNRFSGQIPNVHEDLTTLVRVYFHNNQLTGPIPDWSSLEGMEYYRIAGNDLDPGPIPEWIFDAWSSTLIRFQIQNTNRTGSLSEKITQMEALEQFIIGGPGDTIGEGETTDDIPNMEFMPSLRRINFYGGNWTGTLPEWVGNVTNLEDVRFQDMDITGTIPSTWANSNMINLWLENLNIEGTLPEAFQTTTSLNSIVLVDNENMEYGQIPDWIGLQVTQIEELRLENVGVTGDINDTQLQWLPIEVLNLSDNPDLTGELPEWFEDKNWSHLGISRTGIEVSSIPSWIGSKDNLGYLEMAGLGLEGELPTFFGDGLISVNLQVLALNDNNLTGSIPASYGNILRLDSLNLSNNQLTGEIPVELANAGRVTDDFSLLSAIQLSGNEGLTGEFPLAFTDASLMRVIEFDGTNICEPEDASFQAWLDGISDFAAESYPIAYYSVKTSGISCGSVSNEREAVPNKFQLQQNYPNPFNPTTNIKYEIPEATNVTLTVYNMLGQRVATLLNEQKPAGFYELSFDASALASGTYIYRLEAGGQVATQKMMLIK